MTFLELCAIQPRAGGHERENTEWGLQRQGSASPSLALWSSACPVFQHYWEVWLPLLCSFNLLLIRTKILSITFFSRLSSPSPLSLYYQISSTPFIIFFSGTLSLHQYSAGHFMSSPHLEGARRSRSPLSTFTPLFHWGVPPPWVSRPQSKQTAFLNCLCPQGEKEVSSLLWQVAGLGFSVLLPVAEYYR